MLLRKINNSSPNIPFWKQKTVLRPFTFLNSKHPYPHHKNAKREIWSSWLAHISICYQHDRTYFYGFMTKHLWSVWIGETENDCFEWEL